MLAAFCALLAGCAGDDRYGGREIFRALEGDHIARVDDLAEPTQQPLVIALPDIGAITLGDLLSVADEVNPEIAAARSRVGSAAGRQWQSALYPNPSFGVEVSDMPIDTAPAGGTTTVGITQPIVLGDRLRAARSGGDAGRLAAMAVWEASRREVHGHIASAAAEAVSARELQRVYEGLHLLAEQSLTTAQIRFEARAATESEVLRPQIELYRIDAARDRARRDEAAAVARLSLFLGGLAVDASRLVSPLEATSALPGLPALQNAIRTTHPVIREAQAKVLQAEASLRRVRAERMPDLDLRVAAGYDDAEGEPIMEFGAGMTIPFWDRRQGDILTARFDIATARFEQLAAENALLSQLADSLASFEAAQAQLEVMNGRIAPAAERALEQTADGYRAGRAGFLEVVEAQQTLFESRIAVAELQAQAAEAWADVIQVVGVETVGVHIEPRVPAGSISKEK